MVEIINPENNEVWDYHIDKKLIPYLEKIKKSLSQKDKDYVMVISGHEGAGKSTLAQQIARFVNPSLKMSRICMTSSEFVEAIQTSGKDEAVIYDEAVTGLSSGGSISKIGKLLRSMMMQMRQKNLFTIIVIPTIFELNKYSILYRANSLFHVYEREGKRGYWVGYNRKDIKIIYFKGKKTYSYPVRSFFTGRFYGKYAVNEEEYRKKKEEALFLDEGEDETIGKEKALIIIGLHRDNYSVKEIREALFKWKIRITERQIQRIVKKYKESQGIDLATSEFQGVEQKDDGKTLEKRGKSVKND